MNYMKNCGGEKRSGESEGRSPERGDKSSLVDRGRLELPTSALQMQRSTTELTALKR